MKHGVNRLGGNDQPSAEPDSWNLATTDKLVRETSGDTKKPARLFNGDGQRLVLVFDVHNQGPTLVRACRNYELLAYVIALSTLTNRSAPRFTDLVPASEVRQRGRWQREHATTAHANLHRLDAARADG